MKIKKIISILIIYLILFSQVSAEIFISEVMPNTIDDVNLEYIELTNSWTLEESLSWYIIKDKSEKEFVFWSWYFLNFWESKKYFRPETKILLNNSDEEIFLYDSSWSLIDSFIYEDSVKSEKITSPQSSPLEEMEQDQFDETNSWEILDNSWVINDWSWELDFWTWEITSPQPSPLEGEGEDQFNETNSWEILNSTWIIDDWTWKIEEEIINFDLVYNFQVPTYLLEKEYILNIYNCDRNKEVCKINLDFRDNFEWELREWDFECFLDFGFWTWNLTWEENKCNPNTIIVPIWEYNFNFLIKNKENDNNFATWSFKIINKWYLKEVIDFNSSNNNDNDYVSKIYIKTPEIIVQSWLDEDNLCKKEDCKINLNYENENSYLACEWDFGEWYFTTANTEEKCNPWYVAYTIWDFRVELKVYQKDLPSNYKRSYLDFSNREIIEEIDEDQEEENEKKSFPINQKTSPPTPLLRGEGSRTIIELEQLKYEILKGDNWNFVVRKWTWSILKLNKEEYYNYTQDNFKIYYRKLDKWLRIYWKTLVNTEVKIEFRENEKFSFIDFFIAKASANYLYTTTSDENWDYEFLLTEIKFWDFEIDSNIIDNYWNIINIEKEKNIFIDSGYVLEMNKYVYEKFLEDKKTYSDEIDLTSPQPSPSEERELEQEDININLVPKIEVQWKIWENKKLAWNVLFCYKTCSVNFDWSKSEWDIGNYIWNFWNWEIFEWKNPWYIKYENFWNYTVSLMTIWENGKMKIWYFYVVFEDTKKDIIKEINEEEIDTQEKESSLLINYSEASIEDISDDEKNNWIFYYLIIIIIWIFLLFLILKKEKLI